MRAKEYEILLTVVYEDSNEVEKGKVIRQSIDPTTIVEKNTMIEVVVSSGGAKQRDATISIKLKDIAKGEFEFKYYIDGTLQDDKTEIKNLSLVDNLTWTFTNSGVHEYAVRVRSIDTGAEGTFFVCKVDFTVDPAEKDYGDTFNSKLFKQLLGAVPADTPAETTSDGEEDLPEFALTLPPVTTTTPDNGDNDPDEIIFEETVDDNRVVAEG